MAGDANDADRRREGILLVSNHAWGREGKYAAYYALLAINDPSPLVRAACVRALGKVNDPTYVPQLARAMDDASSVVRLDAAVVLADLTGPAAMEPLRKHAMKDESVDVRMACLKALRHYRDPQVTDVLLQCLGESDFGLRYEARQSLIALTGMDKGYEPADWKVATAQPAAVESPRPSRPWWDWAGVTQKSPPQAAKAK